MIVDRLLRRYPMTSGATALALAVGIPALFLPRLVRALEQNPPLLLAGQWWRLVTPMIVQGYGWSQLVFNVLGIVLAGAAVERRLRTWRWLVVAAGSGVIAIIVTSLLRPHEIDSGSSAAVAGLVGAMTVGMLRTRRLPPLAGLLYGVFFAVYLCALALAGPLAGAVAGSLSIPAVLVVRRVAGRRATRAVAGGLVALAGVLLLARGDAHGIGLVAGAVLGAAVGGSDRSR